MKSIHLLILTLAASLLVLFPACSRKPSPPPKVYVPAVAGASDIQNLTERLKKAYAAHDANAAMELFYWQPADSAGLECQGFWWHLLNKIFTTPSDSLKSLAPDPGDLTKTTLPVVGRINITTSKTSYDLLIGKNENGYYLTPPLWPQPK